MWTTDNNMKGYMVFTCHYIDEDWKLRSCILRFVYVPSPHTAEVLSDVLLQSLIDWNVDRKFSTITVDNCSTNDLAIELLCEKLSKKDLLLTGQVLQMRCNAHILNLIVQVGLSMIVRAIEKIHRCIVFWNASPKRVEKFSQVVQQCGITIDVFPRLALMEKQYKDLPSEDDWVEAGVAVVLEPWYKMKLIEVYFPRTYKKDEEVARMRIEEVLTCCKDFLREYKSSVVYSRSSSHRESNLSKSLHAGTSSKVGSSGFGLSTLSMYDQFMVEESRIFSNPDQCALDYYLKEPVLHGVSNFNVLNWRSVSGRGAYPTLKKNGK